MRVYDRETGKSAYDPDGKAAEKRSSERPENVMVYTAVLAAIMLSVGMIAAAYTNSNRIDYDRAREVERFDRLNTQIFELAVEAIETRQTLARAIRAYHPGGGTSKQVKSEAVNACGELGREIEEGRTYYFDDQGKQWLIVLEEIQ